MKSSVVVHKVLTFGPEDLFYCFLPCSCRNFRVQAVNRSPEPAQQDTGPEVVPFGIFRFGRNVRAVKVTVAELGEDFKGCGFNFGFEDDRRNRDFSFLFFSPIFSFFICQGKLPFKRELQSLKQEYKN